MAYYFLRRETIITCVRLLLRVRFGQGYPPWIDWVTAFGRSRHHRVGDRPGS
jgi:hypothetical protein